MGNIYEIVLTVPHADFSKDKAVENGLRGLGFIPAVDAYGDEGRTVWLRLGMKLREGMDWLRGEVLALPWHDWRAPTHLQVLWSDDYTFEDDWPGGRKAPLSWNHETWEVPR